MAARAAPQRGQWPASTYSRSWPHQQCGAIRFGRWPPGGCLLGVRVMVFIWLTAWVSCGRLGHATTVGHPACPRLSHRGPPPIRLLSESRYSSLIPGRAEGRTPVGRRGSAGSEPPTELRAPCPEPAASGLPWRAPLCVQRGLDNDAAPDCPTLSTDTQLGRSDDCRFPVPVPSALAELQGTRRFRTCGHAAGRDVQ